MAIMEMQADIVAKTLAIAFRTTLEKEIRAAVEEEAKPIITQIAKQLAEQLASNVSVVRQIGGGAQVMLTIDGLDVAIEKFKATESPS